MEDVIPQLPQGVRYCEKCKMPGMKISIKELESGEFVEVWRCLTIIQNDSEEGVVRCGNEDPVTVEIRDGRLFRK